MQKAFWGQCYATERERRNHHRVVRWALAWVGAWLVFNIGIRRDWLPGGIPAVAATLLTAGLGLGMMLAYRRFLREADELRRKIELDALALAVGVGLVGGVSYWLLQRSGTVAYADVFDVTVLLICFSHAVGVFLGYRRHA